MKTYIDDIASIFGVCLLIMTRTEKKIILLKDVGTDGSTEISQMAELVQRSRDLVNLTGTRNTTLTKMTETKLVPFTI